MRVARVIPGRIAFNTKNTRIRCYESSGGLCFVWTRPRVRDPRLLSKMSRQAGAMSFLEAIASTHLLKTFPVPASGLLRFILGADVGNTSNDVYDLSSISDIDEGKQQFLTRNLGPFGSLDSLHKIGGNTRSLRVNTHFDV
jgi:hypothetical protein